MARSNQEMLDSVDAAIAAIEGGAQSYTTLLGEVVTRANLNTLYMKRGELQGLVDALAMGGGAARIEVGLGGVDVAR